MNVKEWKKVFHTHSSHRRTGLAVIVSDKIDFKTEIVMRDNEGRTCNDKRVNSPRSYNKYVLNETAPKYYQAKAARMEGRNSSTRIGDFNTSPSTREQDKIKKEVE